MNKTFVDNLKSEIQVIMVLGNDSKFFTEKHQEEVSQYFSSFQLCHVTFYNIGKEKLQLSSANYFLIIDAKDFFKVDINYFLNQARLNSSIGVRLANSPNKDKDICFDEFWNIREPCNKTQYLPADRAFKSSGPFFITRKKLLDNPSIINKAVHGFGATEIKNFDLKPIPIGGNTEVFLANDPRPCLFLDRDGVIIEDTKYPHKNEDIKLIQPIIDLIKFANQKKWLVCVITNQSGIARGKFSLDQYFNFSEELIRRLNEIDAKVDHWEFCPYHPKGVIEKYSFPSPLRKPLPGMVLKTMEKFNIDLTKSIMIGDKTTDILCGINIKTLLIKGNYPIEKKFKPFEDFSSLVQAAKNIIKEN